VGLGEGQSAGGFDVKKLTAGDFDIHSSCAVGRVCYEGSGDAVRAIGDWGVWTVRRGVVAYVDTSVIGDERLELNGGTIMGGDDGERCLGSCCC